MLRYADLGAVSQGEGYRRLEALVNSIGIDSWHPPTLSRSQFSLIKRHENTVSPPQVLQFCKVFQNTA
ncbi:Oxalate decarboxylase OxdC [Fusarium oxysporum f. sp. albedinis]|nr:Uncharacterized protein HZ326_26044 [Fusarium oxysporum f. sp. albedinis]KAJ0139976.1 Oxalate decarboxylase OxdC [Fusarium oxysporum f. sp. albedinis]